MLRSYSDIFRWFLMAFDYVLIGAAFFAAQLLYKHFNGLFLHGIYFFKAYIWVLPLLLLLWGACLYALGMYNSFRVKKALDILRIIAEASFLSFISYTAIAYVFKLESVNRSFLELFFVCAAGFLAVEKMAIVLCFRRLRARGFNFRNVLIVGTGRRARTFMRDLDRQRELGLNVIGVVDEHPARVGKIVEGHRVFGILSDIPEILRRHVVDFVIFIVPCQSLSKIERSLRQCEMVGVTTSVAVDLFNLRFTMGKETEMMGIPMVTFETTPHSVAALMIKRAFDIAVSVTMLIVLCPLYAILALLIRITSPGPIYFIQERCGLNGRVFKLYKFRTMVQNAETQLKDLLAHNEMDGPAFKMSNDPRITKIGRFLRKYSLDELPQIWNVFHGDMSLVGPRPPLPSEVQKYDTWHHRRLSIRPGLTCTWQAGGRNRISNFDQWVRMDLDYIDHWSLLLDLKIILKTIPAVFSTAGAK